MELNKPKWLRLDLQTFAQGGAGDPPPTDPIDPPAPTYTQVDIDRIVGERLAREKAKAEKAVEDAKAEAERKRLEEESEFKTLYEQSQARIAEIEAQAKVEALVTKKKELLIAAGYSADKLTDVLGFITGDDEDAITASVERFKNVAPPTPTYVDPGAGNGAKKTPAQKEVTDYGRELYERVFKTNK